MGWNGTSTPKTYAADLRRAVEHRGTLAVTALLTRHNLPPHECHATVAGLGNPFALFADSVALGVVAFVLPSRRTDFFCRIYGRSPVRITSQ